MIAHIRNTNRRAARSRWLLLLAPLAFFPVSARCQEQQVEVSTDYLYSARKFFRGRRIVQRQRRKRCRRVERQAVAGPGGRFRGVPLGGPPLGVDGRMFTYTFGTRFSPRSGHGPLHPFGQFLLGGATLSASLSGQHAGENGFAILAGGGLDARVQTHIAIRCVEVDYLMTRFDRTVGTPGFQNDVRVSTGLVFRFDIDRR